VKTKPNKFESGEHLIELWRQFCNSIVDNEFNTVPTQTAFCRWLEKEYEKTDRKTIYNSLNKIFPSIKKDFEQLQSDVIMQGGMMGKYNPTMSIFGLKNWCGWSDSGRVTTGRYDEEKAEDALSKALREEAERMQNGELQE
jgi:hypothetical protein